MYTIQAGPLLLNGQILLLLAFGLLGWFALRLYVQKFHLEKELVSAAFNAFLIWLLVWKGSPLLIDTAGVIHHPETLIFLDGGTPGRWLGSIAAGLYVYIRFKKGNLSWRIIAAAATVYLLGGTVAYHAGLFFFEPDLWMFHIGHFGVMLLILLTFLVPERETHWHGILWRWQWISFGLAFVWFFNPGRTLLLFSFGLQQIVSIVAGSFCLMILWLACLERRNV